MTVKRRACQHTHLCILSPVIYFIAFDVSRETFIYLKLHRILQKELFCRYKMSKLRKQLPPILLTHCDHNKGNTRLLLFLDSAGGNETMGLEAVFNLFFFPPSVEAHVAD